ERDHGVRHALAAAPMQSAGTLHRFEIALDARDAVLDQTPVGFELRFARTAEKAEAATLAFEVRPGAHQPPLLVVEVRELDLQRALAGARAPAEDFENQPGAVEHLGVPRLL